MEFGDKQYDSLKKKQFYGKLIMALLEDTTQEKQQPRKSRVVDCGGRQS